MDKRLFEPLNQEDPTPPRLFWFGSVRCDIGVTSGHHPDAPGPQRQLPRWAGLARTVSPPV
ncbi:hypothetical protein D623_10008604 [Myotis brandtii]|uniref:Uncharacterized protein n=1 Tax=Myotis brandtii TaxID=109478 RepID=S7MG60_MYOBR|nr:hypothetical protein D623_10008604 [Myotis brandtii]